MPQAQGAPLGVDQVPDASVGSDLVLPLFHIRAVVYPGAKHALESVMTCGGCLLDLAAPHLLVGHQRVRGRLSAQLVSALRGLTDSES